MAKTLIGLVTYGGFEFSKLTIESLKETTKNPIDFFVVVGKPDDRKTLEYLVANNIKYVTHSENLGFPYGLNDIFDEAWVHNNYDNLIIVGNDIVAYENSADSLIDFANSSDYECISALQYDVKDLVRDYPEAREYFHSEEYIITDLSTKPWELFTGYNHPKEIANMQLYDIQNMCLYRRSVFDKVGYTDVAYFPAYFVDNDYAMRMTAANIKCCTLMNARFFHFWSRTIFQGANRGSLRHEYFRNNEAYYKYKFGGYVGREVGVPTIKISDRSKEKDIINFWKSKVKINLTMVTTE